MRLTIGDRWISFSEDAVKKYKSKDAFVKDTSEAHKIADETILKEKLGEMYDTINPPKKGKE